MSERGVYVFLGPTLPCAEARTILDATYLPPVKMGGVHALLRERPRAIVVIDGLFEQTPAVWHKEILAALEQGVRVFGASSMGALRAAELADLGMEGVGEIFEKFRSGELTDDDEVAVIHAARSEGYQSLSEAMVNLRDGLRRAAAAQVIAEDSAALLVAEAKRTFYADRSWNGLLHAGARLGVAAAELDGLRRFVADTVPNLKRDDARAVLGHVRGELARGLMPRPPVVRLERTSFWLELVASTSPAGEMTGALPYERLRDHVRASRADLDELRRGALLFQLVEAEAARAGIVPTRERLQTAQERFRRRRGLGSAAATAAWMGHNGLDARGFARLVQLEALTEELIARRLRDVDERLGDELRRRDELAGEHRAALIKHAHLERCGVVNPTLEDAGASADQILAWYQKRIRAIAPGTTVDDHARELGFDSVRGFLAELLAQYIHEHDVEKDVKETNHEQAS